MDEFKGFGGGGGGGGVMVRDMIEWMDLLEKESTGYLGFPTLPVTGDGKSQGDHVHEEVKTVGSIPDRSSWGLSGHSSGDLQQAIPVGLSPGAQERYRS